MGYDALVVMGPPGAGKGTLCRQLDRLDSTYYFSSGDNFRALAKQDSSLAREFRSVLERGEYFPDDLAVRLLRERLAEDAVPAGSLLLLDGIPRTAAQVDLLEELVDVRGVVGLYAPRDTLLARLRGRAARPADRDVEKARARILEYERKTLPALARYAELGRRVVMVPAGELPASGVCDHVLYRFADI